MRAVASAVPHRCLVVHVRRVYVVLPVDQAVVERDVDVEPPLRAVVPRCRVLGVEPADHRHLSAILEPIAVQAQLAVDLVEAGRHVNLVAVLVEQV